jgi:hypothetical protein
MLHVDSDYDLIAEGDRPANAAFARSRPRITAPT